MDVDNASLGEGSNVQEIKCLNPEHKHADQGAGSHQPENESHDDGDDGNEYESEEEDYVTKNEVEETVKKLLAAAISTQKVTKPSDSARKQKTNLFEIKTRSTVKGFSPINPIRGDVSTEMKVSTISDAKSAGCNESILDLAIINEKASILLVSSYLNPTVSYDGERKECEKLMDSIRPVYERMDNSAIIQAKELALSTFVESIDSDVLVKASNLFQYLGFDTRAIRDAVLSKASVDDVLFCLLVVMKRGTNIEKMKKKMPEAGVNKLTQIIINVGITVGSTSKGKGAETLTFGRIAAAFPEITAKVIKRIGVPNNHGYTGDLPNYYMFPQAPAIIPDDNIYVKWKEWNNRFTHTINGGTAADWGKKIIASPPVDYGAMAYNSTFFPSVFRKQLKEHLDSM